MIRRILAGALLTSLLALLSLLGAACSKDHRFHIESNTCWGVSLDDQNGTVANDCGNATFRVAGSMQCVRIRNLTDTGYVRVRIDEGPWVESTAPQGAVKTCR